MANTATLHDAFLDELRDSYDAERQLVKALPKLAKTATNAKLKEAFESHLEETRGHVELLEQVFESLNEKPRGKHCEGIAGIIDEGKDIMEVAGPSAVPRRTGPVTRTAIRSNARLGTEVLQKGSVYCNDARCWIARFRASSSEPRMTSIFSSSAARCPGESDACGSTC